MSGKGEICEGCGEEIVGFAVKGYCEDCICEECGETLGTEDERAVSMCRECEEK